jgi:hypothetical protein
VLAAVERAGCAAAVDAGTLVPGDDDDPREAAGADPVDVEADPTGGPLRAAFIADCDTPGMVPVVSAAAAMAEDPSEAVTGVPNTDAAILVVDAALSGVRGEADGVFPDSEGVLLVAAATTTVWSPGPLVEPELAGLFGDEALASREAAGAGNCMTAPACNRSKFTSGFIARILADVTHASRASSLRVSPHFTV